MTSKNIKGLFFLLIFVFVFSSCAIDKKALQSNFSEMKIQGFTQFDVYRSNSMLGYVPSGENKFNFKVWEGMVKQDELEQTIRIRYRGKSAFQFSAKFLKIGATALSNHQVVGIDLFLENPVVYSLKNPSPATIYLKRDDFLKKQYIGSVLKVDKIKVRFVKENGTTVSVEASYKIVKAGVKFHIDKKQKALFFARDAFIGYKLFDPPQNAASLGAFTLEYQFLYQPQGKNFWQLLAAHDKIVTGGNLKFRIRGSHPAYLYVFNLDSAGKVYTLFPNPKIDYNSPLIGGKTYFFPKQVNQAFEVDAVKGVEEFIIMVFREKPVGMDKLLEKIRKGKLTKTVFQKDRVVKNSRGVGKIKVIKIKNNSSVPGFKFKVKQITGLPADYKETFILKHE